MKQSIPRDTIPDVTTPPAEVIAIRPGGPLEGTVTVDGAKNAALPVLAAAAVVSAPMRVTNIPDSTDVHTLLGLLLLLRLPAGQGTDLRLQLPDGALVVFIDCNHVKVRDGQVANRPVYVALAVTVAGHRDILGLWVGDGGEGATYRLQILTELKNRGVEDVCMVVCDGLKGLPDAIGTVSGRSRSRRPASFI